MPCYFFTLHGYCTWMPDHRRGYVRRGRGIQPRDEKVAAEYRGRAKREPAHFDEDQQRVMIAALIEGCEHQRLRLHAVFFEVTHVHFLVSWTAERGWLAVRGGLRQSMTRQLGARFERREWFSGSGSRKRVRDRAHFDYLVTTYRRKHRGLYWLANKSA